MKYEIYQDESADREWRWRLLASNGRNIANGGQGYSNKADCLRGIELVKSSADAPVVEASA